MKRTPSSLWQQVLGICLVAALAVPACLNSSDQPPGSSKPRFVERVAERQQMVDDLLRYHFPGVTDKRVIGAMRQVPRHRFVPASVQRDAYDDTPLPIGHGQTISQPYIVALMTELANVKPGMKVLEVGTGSGYQAAVLSELTPPVFTLEIVQPLAAQVKKRFKKLGYKKITAKEGDGYYGWPQHAPFDRIVVTAAAAHIPPPLVKQLKPGGRMVIPVGPRWGSQYLLLITKDEKGRVRSKNMLAVRFVPLVGGPGKD